MNSTDPFHDALTQATHLVSGCAMRHEIRDASLRLIIQGSTSSAIPDEFTNAISHLFAELKPKRAVIDLTACPHLASVMLALLVFYQKHAEEHGAGKVLILGANARIATMIRMIGMADFFTLVPDEKALSAALAGPT